MCYSGSKKMIAKEIHDVIIEYEKLTTNKIHDYLEPFMGMLSMTTQFNDGRKRVVSDINKDIVAMWQSVLDNTWSPPTFDITREQYYALKAQEPPNIDRANRGFYGTSCSFGGKFFGSFFKNRDVEKSVWNKIQTKMVPLLDNVVVHYKNYKSYRPINKLIYCDPPYINTQGYNKAKFDTDEFWDVMRVWAKDNLVFISELKAPDDFTCIWSKVLKKHVKHTSYERKECLFVHKSLLETE